MSDGHSILELTARSERGDPEAQYLLGRRCYEGDGVERDPERAVSLISDAARAGYAEAEYTYGYFLLNGIGMPADAAEAIRWYRRAADQGYPEAQYGLGYICDKGLGIPVNKMEAAKWYLLAADQGHPGAQCNLGILYYNGWGIRLDRSEAFTLFSKSADQGNVDAMFNVARMFETGEGTGKDPAKAVEWYGIAASHGEPNSLREIGLRYLYGDGVAKDEALAARMLSYSAERGDRESMLTLGMMYYSGIGVEKDLGSARGLFRGAAESWDPLAIFMLGLMYLNGEGIEADERKGMGLIRLSSEIGCPEAAEFLAARMRSSEVLLVPRNDLDGSSAVGARVEDGLESLGVVAEQGGALLALGENGPLGQEVVQHPRAAGRLHVHVGEHELDDGPGLQAPVALLGEDVVDALCVDVGAGISHHGRVGEEPDGLLHVHGHADALLVHQAEMVHGAGIEIVGRPAEDACALLRVGFDALAGCDEDAVLPDGGDMPALGGLPEPFGGLGGVLGCVAGAVEVLGIGTAMHSLL